MNNQEIIEKLERYMQDEKEGIYHSIEIGEIPLIALHFGAFIAHLDAVNLLRKGKE